MKVFKKPNFALQTNFPVFTKLQLFADSKSSDEICKLHEDSGTRVCQNQILRINYASFSIDICKKLINEVEINCAQDGLLKQR